MFIGFARQYGERKEVDTKWQQLLEFEAEVMTNLSAGGSIHG
jgi:tRNA-(ms[2]io[6]A)-hydroxylase